MTTFVNKPWGGEEIFAHTDRYVGKILTVKEGHSLSLQYHVHKDETMRILDGRCELHLGSSEDQRALRRLVLEAGQICHIPPGTVHRLVALTDVRIIEVSTPELTDVVRLEDCYGRAGTSDP